MMKIIRNTLPISEIYRLMQNGDLTVNKKYQRTKDLWPLNARSYFIDTILNEYPFPKVVVRQMINLLTKVVEREIVDGQQRLMTIKDFLDDKFTLTPVSKKYQHKRFSDLDEDVQRAFLSYEVSIDIVISASEEEILEIFRRINSYTLPLNPAEKRHASYQGEFKWYIRDLIDYYTPVLEKYKVLSLREISRMMDADLFTELTQIAIEGIVTRSSNKLEALYKNNDKAFINKEDIVPKIFETLDFIKLNLLSLLENETLKSYSFYSLFSALFFNKYGIQNLNLEMINGSQPEMIFVKDVDKAISNILTLQNAVEEKDTKGYYADYVKASIATTHSINNRMVRLKWLLDALQNQWNF